MYSIKDAIQRYEREIEEAEQCVVFLRSLTPAQAEVINENSVYVYAHLPDPTIAMPYNMQMYAEVRRVLAELGLKATDQVFDEPSQYRRFEFEDEDGVKHLCISVHLDPRYDESTCERVVVGEREETVTLHEWRCV